MGHACRLTRISGDRRAVDQQRGARSSLRAEGDEGINPCGAKGGEEARDGGDGEQEHGIADEHQRIVRGHAEEKGVEQAGEPERRHEADRDAGQDEPEAPVTMSWRTSRRWAPIAMRMPISWVR